MNAVEIAEAVAELVEQPFDREEFPYSFLAAFDNPPATIERLKSGTTNNSDVGGVLQRNNIHILTCDIGRVGDALEKLRESAATKSQKAKFILATDGVDIEVEDLQSGETLACPYTDLDEKFGFFLPLANITTVREIRENSFDIKATGRLNKLYVELIKHNPEWSQADKRHEMNHFMARLIFCFFSEDTGIFQGENLLTTTIEKMSSRDASDVHVILGTIFKTMNTKNDHRELAGLPRWAMAFPYVNGGLFSGSVDVPNFTKIARSYLLHIGKLDWTKINPDVFGSMIQAVADDEQRGALGMHYTSVPNILKVLNPLFLDDLRQKLEEAGTNLRKLLNLRERIQRIRVFDPACGSGNFLVIAYKEMRAIEAEINKRRGEDNRSSGIPITNFRGIELLDFPAEMARLALIIAEYQCDAIHVGQKEAIDAFLPLDHQNWITCGNALQIDWLSVCPPTGANVKFYSDDLFSTPVDQAEIDFVNEGGETFICGNPPYLGSTWQSDEQKADLRSVFQHLTSSWKSLDYVAAWFMKAVNYSKFTPSVAAFVSTNSICQGQQVPIIWPLIFGEKNEIIFAYNSFSWSNLASHNAGVTVSIIGISNIKKSTKKLFSINQLGETVETKVRNINAYLVPSDNVIIKKHTHSISDLPQMKFGNKAVDGGNLLLTSEELADLKLTQEQQRRFIRRIRGSAEFTKGIERYCIWIQDAHLEEALDIKSIAERIERVRQVRLASRDSGANELSIRSHQMREMNIGEVSTIIVPRTSTERRKFLPCGLVDKNTTVTSEAFALFDVPIWNMSLITSSLHRVWIATVCGKMRIHYRYSNTLGWNTFPVPNLTTQNKDDLKSCAEEILLAREAHYPATITDLYDPDNMPTNLKIAHEQNDEILERIYIGRRFRNDSERIEKLFELYKEMTTTVSPN